MKVHRTRIVTAVLTPLMLVGTLFVTTAMADGNDGREVRKHGVFASGATRKLEAEDEGARLQVEFEIDRPKVGVPWAIKFRHNGEVFERVVRTTDHEGEIDVERMVRDTLGADTLGVRAVNLRTGTHMYAQVKI